MFVSRTKYGMREESPTQLLPTVIVQLSQLKWQSCRISEETPLLLEN